METREASATFRVDHEHKSLVLMQHHLDRADQLRDMICEVSSSLSTGNIDIIELDLGNLDRLNSSTLNDLISLNTRAKSHGVRLVIVNLADELRHIFSITRLERMFELA